MGAKWSVTPLVKRHLETLTDQRDERHRPRILDYLAFYGLPLLLGGFSYFAGFRLRGVEGILAGTSIFTALLFGLLIHVFTLGLRVTDDPRIANGSKTARLIDQLQANVAYSVLVGILSTIVLVVGVSTTNIDSALGSPISALTVAVLSHLVLTILMALKRTQAAYEAFRS